MIDLVSLGALFGLGAPDLDLVILRLGIGVKEFAEEMKMLIFRYMHFLKLMRR